MLACFRAIMRGLVDSGKYKFTKEYRILRRPEFVRLSQNGKKIQNRHFLLFYTPGRENRTRLGVTVTKRVGNAVTRNRLKRLARECFRVNRNRFKKDWDISLIAKKEAAGLPTQIIIRSIEELFNKISDS